MAVFLNRRGWLIAMLALLLSGVVLAEDEVEEGEAPAPVASKYFDVKPAFIANFGGPGKLRYVKTDITLRVKGQGSGMQDVRHHLPYIRHALVMLLSRQSVENVSSVEGRELLRQDALEEVRRVLMEEEGEQFVLDLLFNSFIVQG